ncbi:MAG TPA: hypothetical protein VL992_08150 [Tepidisphaeraceae bacterium]|nr:hypothetical protein [Tepidisphaeraceae bacterium]
MRSHLCFALILLIAATARAQSDSIAVTGEVDHPGSFSVSDLKSQFASDLKTIQISRRGQQHSADVVPLLSLLKAAGIKMDLKMGPSVPPTEKNYALRLVVIVTGRDGYAAAFALAELLPQFGNHPVWLELAEDGNALPDRDQPMDLVVPDDVKPGRWVHGIGTITILNATTATTQPSNSK